MAYQKRQKYPPWFSKDELIKVAQRRHLQIVQRHPHTSTFDLVPMSENFNCLLYQFIYFANAYLPVWVGPQNWKVVLGCLQLMSCICFWCFSQPAKCYKIFSQNPFEGQKYFLSQIQSKLFHTEIIPNIHMDFFLDTYISGSTPSASRKKPIGVFFLNPKVSATFITWKCACENVFHKQYGPL